MNLFLAILVCGALQAPGDPLSKEWAAGLGSAKSEERYATIDAIESQGSKALPALREIVATVTGEPRVLANELIERIGTRRLLRPTLVTLDLTDRTLAEAVENLSQASGYSIVLDPKIAVNSTRVTLRTDRPIPFYEALDRLALAGGVRQDLSPTMSSSNKREVRVHLVAATRPLPPTSYVGPYKVILRSLERHREVVQTRDAAEAKVREEFFAVLDVVAEPGILVDRNGSAHVQEAIDDRGQNLRAASSSDPAGTSNNTRAWGMADLGQFSYRLPLQLPDDHGPRISRLKGFIPITAFCRTDEIFSSAIAGIDGKTLEGGGIRLRVNRASITGIGGFFEVTLRGEHAPDGLNQVFAPGPRQTALATLRHGFGLDDHLRIEDAQGNPFGCHANGTAPMAPDGSMNYRITLLPNGSSGPPVRLRYFGVAGVATEVPFEFRDLEIP